MNSTRPPEVSKKLSPVPEAEGQECVSASRTAVVCLALVLGCICIYWQVHDFEFTNYDDPEFVSQNPFVQGGLSWSGVVFAFTQTIAANWHPITILSHMLDVQLFGLRAGAHHLVNVAFHAINAVLLFLVVKRMTRRFWCSALVAALFAWHPLHVESVAWVAERKDLLSGLFWILALWAYVRYVAQPGISRYLLVLLFFALGLMSKPMGITLPFVLLLLDYWPLGRLQLGPPAASVGSVARHQPPAASRQAVVGLLIEKLPLLLLALAASVLTFFVQEHDEATKILGGLALSTRLGNAAVSYARYLGKTFVPIDLVVLYPHPGHWATSAVVGALLLLAALSVAALVLARRQPWWLVGWLWFLGTLIPVIGLVQVGWQAMADRYTYLPLVGLFIALAWGAAHLASSWALCRRGLPVAVAGLLLGCVATSWFQTRHWQSSVTLFSHALAKTTHNPMAHANLGQALEERGRIDEAIQHYSEVIRLQPDYAPVYNNLGLLLSQRDQPAEALRCFETAVRLRPNEFLAHYNLAQFLWLRGQASEAVAEYREVLRLRPDIPEVLNNLAWILATHPQAALRNGPEAVRLAQRGCELTNYQAANLLGALAAAYAEAGQFKEAVETAQKAVAVAAASGQEELANRYRRFLQLFQQGKPFHQSP